MLRVLVQMVRQLNSDLNTKLDDIINYIKNMDAYKNYLKTKQLMSENPELIGMIDEVKKYQKDIVRNINGEDKNCLELALYTKAKIITYGLNDKCNYNAKNISFNEEGYPSYDLYKKDKFITRIELSVIGNHNVLNSLACISLCLFYNINIENIKKALKKYTGAARRFEYKGTFKKAKVYDDYGHHPTEVKAISNAILNKDYNKSWVIFEPHTYSRVKEHYKSFADSLLNFDNIIITDIYAAREKNVDNVSPEMIIKELDKLGKKAIHISDFNEIKSYLSKNIQDNDLILTLGAGYITKLSEMLIND